MYAVGPRYKLQAHVGSGSYGDVCRAMDLEFGQIVALKVRLWSLGFSNSFGYQLQNEACPVILPWLNFANRLSKNVSATKKIEFCSVEFGF